MLRGHVEKRGKSRYYTIVFEHDPIPDPDNPQKLKRVREYVPTALTDKRKALDEMDRVRAEMLTGTRQEAGKTTLGEYLDHWLDTAAKPNIAHSTYRSYEMFIAVHLKPILGKIRLVDLTPIHLQRYYADKMESGRHDKKGGLSARTVLHHHRMLRYALKQAVMWGMIPTNPADRVRPPSEPPTRVKPPTLEEALIVIGTCQEPFRTALLVAVWTGARLGEVLGLRWEDVSPGEIRIEQKLYKPPGEDYTFQAPKRHSQRAVPIPPSLSEHLEAQRRPDGLVLRSPTDPDKPLNPSSVYHHFKRVASRLGVAVDARVHDLRHAYASTLLAEGIEARQVMELTGHKQMKTLYESYAHVIPKQRQQIADTLGRLDGRRNGDNSEDLTKP